ncbi:MAG: long-chain fatty acid--CoA ligase [Deltaproteobacteria bacterium]|nr:long-chain fatty acid--CoA ligase [Deltaproteobacteria bacterium]
MAERFGNLVQLFERSVEKYRARDLFGVKKGGSWQWITYGAFSDEVDAVRGGLGSLGVQAGDRVAIIADNRVEWAAACYATYGLAASYAPMYESQLAKEWEFILKDCGAKVVLVATRAIAEKVGTLRANLPALQHVVSLEGDEGQADSYAALLERGTHAKAPSRHPSSSDLAGLIYTSGTTGTPKGVMLSHGNIRSNINAVLEIFTFEPDDRSLAFLPWAHSFGQTCELHGLLAMGCSIAINDEIPKLVENLAEVKPTILFAVPRIFNRIYDGVNKQIAERPAPIQSLVKTGVENATKKTNGESIGILGEIGLWLADTLAFSKIRGRFGGRLKYAISGSAALSREVADFIDGLGIMVYEGYGLTETSPISTANFPGARKIGSVGKAIPGVTIKIDRTATNHERDGEILVYGPNVMMGYHNRPEENRAVLMEDGGFRTGDMGYLDADGFLYITGRIKEQYKLENGKYVVPSPLEEQIKLSPYIANVFVFGDNRPYNVAVVVPERSTLEEWAKANAADIAHPNDCTKIRGLIEKELDEKLGEAKGYEKVKNFVVVGEDFTTENGMLTPTLKLKRRAVLDRYGKLLENLY